MIRIPTFVRCAIAALCMFVASAVIAAQDQRSSQPESSQSATDQQVSQPPPGKQAQQPPQNAKPTQPESTEREPAGRPVNLMIEVTITDQVESEPAEKKTVSMMVADRTTGRVRASGLAQSRETPGIVQVKLNVDASPEIQANDSIRLRLTVEYEPLPPAPAADTPRRPSQLNEMLTVILQPGKPLTVSRAVDPFTNRRTSVEVTASIAK